MDSKRRSNSVLISFTREELAEVIKGGGRPAGLCRAGGVVFCGGATAEGVSD